MWYKRRLAQNNECIYRQKLDIPMNGSLHDVLEIFNNLGYEALIVGGAVRDAFMGLKSKDIDVEVYGIMYPKLQSVLSNYLDKQRELATQGLIEVPRKDDGSPKYNGHVDFAGKQFGVVKFADLYGEQYDFSVPRRESKRTEGGLHTDFDIVPDPTMTPKDAAARRDFTWNCLAFNPLTDELHDYFGGVKDLNNGIIRHTSPAFADDELRVLRGLQFAARFGFDLAPETAELSKQMSERFINNQLTHPNRGEEIVDGKVVNVPHLATERIAEEFMKLATKGKYPSKVFKYLHDTGWDKFFPELLAMQGVPQDPTWHPEGDVEVHTAHVLDAASEIADREGLKGDERATLILSALLHDVAKPATTKQREKQGELRWTAYGHEKAGGPLAEEFLKRIGIKPEIIQQVKALIENHLGYVSFGANPSDKAINALAQRLNMSKTNIRMLMMLIESDVSGRPPLPKQLDPKAVNVREKAKGLGVYERPQVPFLQGKDIMDIAPDITPGPIFGQILNKFYALQESGAIKSREQALAQLEQFFDNKRKYTPSIENKVL